MLGGRRGGIFTAVGVSTGQALWTVAASAGLAALLVASEPAFLALKFAGAVYLVYLGGHALVGALRNRPSMLPASAWDSLPTRCGSMTPSASCRRFCRPASATITCPSSIRREN